MQVCFEIQWQKSITLFFTGGSKLGSVKQQNFTIWICTCGWVILSVSSVSVSVSLCPSLTQSVSLSVCVCLVCNFSSATDRNFIFSIQIHLGHISKSNLSRSMKVKVSQYCTICGCFCDLCVIRMVGLRLKDILFWPICARINLKNSKIFSFKVFG